MADGTRAASRRLPVGAELQAEGGVHFRVWAPRCRRVDAIVDEQVTALRPESNGYFSALVEAAKAGSRYRYRLDGGESYPDPASRFQPEGPHGSSQVIDPAAYRWTDEAWRGARLPGQVIYELHIGTFTAEGTWAAAARELDELAGAGITALEVMPVADFCGEFGWGYDGVDLFAPTRLYGTPDEFRAFVDRAHRAGLAVLLDVVYNHLGPDGNYLECFSADYFTRRYENEWGEPINFDGDDSAAVRELFTANAAYWVDEFHIDGLRLDATQQIFDASPRNVMADITRAVRRAAGGRATLVIAENEPQDVRLLRPDDQAGFGMDALWNDDFHHSATVALGGRREAYYSDYRGSAQELVSAVKHGFLYQGQHYAWQGKRRGSPTFGIAARALVSYLENHDQVANSARGLRGHQAASPARWRALTTLLLLGPATPMLFQGQEFSASSPFLFFADHAGELAESVRKGRAAFLEQFPSIAAADMSGQLADPGDVQTFRRCKLDFAERERHAEAYALHRDLLRLRREDAVFSRQGEGGIDGAVLGPDAFVLRFFGDDGDDRLLLVNLGRELPLSPAPEPLLAPPAAHSWSLLWSSEAPRYGGNGTPAIESAKGGWHIPAQAAFAMRAEAHR